MKNKFLTKLLCFVISIMMIIPTGLSFVAAAGEEDPFEALKDYGVYTFANSDGDEMSGLAVESGNKRNNLYTKSEMEQALADGVNADFIENLKTGEYSSIDCNYFGGDAYDGPWRYENIGGKDAWFTTKFIRNGKGLYGSSNIYFNLMNDDKIGINDNNVTLLVEYFDNDAANFGILYWSTASHKSVSVTGTATDTWKTAVFNLTDAKFTSTNEKTALGSDQKADFRVQTGKDTYISRVMVVKTEDYNKFLNGELGGNHGGSGGSGGGSGGSVVTPPGGDTQEPANPETIDLAEFNDVAVYINSSDYADGNGEGLNVVSSNNNAFGSPASYNTDLIDLSVPANMDAVNALDTAKANYAAHPEVGYANIGGAAKGSDGAWMIKDDSFFTSQYITGRATNNWCAYVGGAFYLTVKDKLTTSDNGITFIIEYLDEGEKPLTIQYTNTDFVNGSDKPSLTSTDIARTNSGELKRAIVQVDNANVAAGLSKTALADKAAQIKLCSNGIDTYVKSIYIMKTSDFDAVIENGGAIGGGNGGNEEEDDDDEQLDPMEGTIFDVLKNYGTYVDADLHGNGRGLGLDVLTAATSQVSGYDNLILPLTDPSYANASAQVKANVASEPTLKYFQHGGNDAGTGFVKISDGEVEHNTFFTTRYATSRTDWCAKIWGSIYFTNTAKFTKDDNELTLVIEFLDNGTKDIGIQYVKKMDDGSVKTQGSASFYRTNTGKWKTDTVSLTDACLYEGIKGTVLADQYQSMKVMSNGEDLYISKFMVVKTADYQAYLDGTLAKTDDMIVGNAKAQLKLDIKETKENFTLPSTDVEGVTVTWKSDNDAIKINGNTAVVTQGASDATVKLTATLSKGNVTETKSFEVKVPAKFGKAAGAEIIIGATPEQDETVGGIEFDAGNSLFKRDEPETVTGSGLMYETELTADWDSMRVQAGPENDKRWAAFTSNYYRPNRTNSLSCGGNIPFNISEFSETDNKLTFEIDYLDVGTGSLGILYVTDAAKGMAKSTINKSNSGEWKTWTVTLTNAKFSSSNAQSGIGKSNRADIRFEGSDIYISRVEVYTSKAYKDVIGAKQALNIENVYDENGIAVAGGTVSSNFELPETIEGFDGSEITWESSNTDAIMFDGNVAKVFLSETGKQIVTITATIVIDGCFVQKSFEVILAKKDRQLYIASDPIVTGEKTNDATVSFVITNTDSSIGKQVALIVASIDEETDEILKINVVRKEITGSTLDINATVDNTKGKLAYYLTIDNGAVMYNIAPGAIRDFTVGSTEKGINIMWKAPEDDNNFIKEYVLYDGKGNMIDVIPGDETSYFVPLTKYETRSYCMEGIDHAGFTTGLTEVKSGTLFKGKDMTVKLYDLEGKGSNVAMFNDLITNAGTDNHTHAKKMTDKVTGETLECRHTVNRPTPTCTCGLPSRNGNTFLYFKKDGTYVTADTKEVAVIVKYYDYGTGNINYEYNTYNNYINGGQGSGKGTIALTGTNTFKTAVIKIYDAGFYGPSTLSNADIRFSGGPNGEVYFAEVTIMPLANYAEVPTPDVFIAGDSIASVYPEGNSRIGWGMELPKLLTSDVNVVNKAVAGSSTKTFPNMDAIISNADKNDYVLMSFGHNDSMNNDRGVTVDDYKKNLINYINKITDKKATPVIITSIPQINHSNGTLIYDKQNPDGIMAYRDAAIEVAKIMGVEYIDLAGIMAEEAKDMTKEQVLALYEEVTDPEKADASHISKAGAQWVAGIIARELKDARFGLISSFVK